MKLELERRQALIDLMETTDEFDRLRVNRLTVEGAPDRFSTLVPHLTSVFVQGRLMEFEARNSGQHVC